MSILPIYLFGSEVLRKKAKPIHELDDAAIKLMYDLAETMRKANGIGLAATQVGELRRMIVVDVSAAERSDREDDDKEETAEQDAESKILVLINPEIVEEQGSTTMEEGCLSLPNLRAEVGRAENVSVKYRDVNFEENVLKAEGMLARVILHETDHLNGVLFIDRLGKTRRALLKSELKKIEKGEVDTSYPSISAVEV